MRAYFVFQTRETKPESINVSLRHNNSSSKAMSAIDNNYIAYVDNTKAKLYNDSLHTEKGRKPGSRVEFNRITDRYELI